MFMKRLIGLAVTCVLLSMTGVASALPTFSILGPGTTETPPYVIESTSENSDPPWGILQSPAETIYRSQSPSTATTLSLSAPAKVIFQYLGHGDSTFVNEFKVLDAAGAPLLIWCTQGSSIVGCPEAKINPGFGSGPTTPFVASTTAELNLPAGLLRFEFIGNISTEGVPGGPESGAVFNTAASNTCGLDANLIGTPPHPGDVCFGIAVPLGAGTNGLNSAKLGFKDGGQSIPYDPDYQDMVIKVTVSSAEAEVAVPATSPQGLLVLALLMVVAAMWRFRKGRR